MKRNPPKNRSARIWYRLLWISLAYVLGFSSCQGLPSPGLETPTTQLPTLTGHPPTEVRMPLAVVPAVSQDLSGPWHFAVDREGKGEAEGWADPAFQDSAWQMVTVPHT